MRTVSCLEADGGAVSVELQERGDDEVCLAIGVESPDCCPANSDFDERKGCVLSVTLRDDKVTLEIWEQGGAVLGQTIILPVEVVDIEAAMAAVDGPFRVKQ